VTVRDVSATPAVAVAAKPTAKPTAADAAKAIHTEAAEVKLPVLFDAPADMQPADAAAVAVTDVSAAAAAAGRDKLIAVNESFPAHEALAIDGNQPVMPPALTENGQPKSWRLRQHTSRPPSPPSSAS